MNEALGDVGKSKLEKHFFLVFSGLQGFGPADGGCCRSQKLMPHIRNIGVGLSVAQFAEVSEKGRGRELSPFARQAFSLQSGWQEEEKWPLRG